MFTIFCITVFRGLIKHIEINSKSAASNFVPLKNCIMPNISFTKTKQNTYEVLSSIPQNYAKMSKISKG